MLSNHLLLPDNISLHGSGPFYSLLQGYPQSPQSKQSVGLYGNNNFNIQGASQGITLTDLAIEGRVGDRCDSCDTNGIGGSLGGGSLVQNIWVRHTKCGVWLNGPFSDLHMLGNDIRNTMADGTNLHGGISWTTIEHSRVRVILIVYNHYHGKYAPLYSPLLCCCTKV